MSEDVVHQEIPAEIVEIPTSSNGYSYVVNVEGRGNMFLRGLGAPSPGRVGEKGTVKYTIGPGHRYGLYFWKSAERKEARRSPGW